MGYHLSNIQIQIKNTHSNAVVDIVILIVTFFVDGNGVLHPIEVIFNLVFMVFLLLTLNYDVYHVGFGLASHLGVLTGIPTIGVGKNMYFIDMYLIDGMANDNT